MKKCLAFLLTLVLFASVGRAQLLSERVPADAVVFVGWKGVDELGPGYDQTRLKKFIDASAIRELIDRSIPGLLARIGESDRHAQELTDLLVTFAKPMFHHTSAFYFGGVDSSRPGQMTPRIAILCDAKADAPALVARLNELIQKAGRTPFAIQAMQVDSLVVLEIGKTPFSTKEKIAPLAQDARFKKAIEQTQADSVYLAYLDGHALLKMIADDLAESDRNNKSARKVTTALGLDGLDYAIFTGGFTEADWTDRAFIAAPSPRRGLLTWFDDGPLSKEILSAAPVTSTVLAAGQLDLAGLYTKIRAGLGEFDPKLQQNFDSGVAEFNEQTGFDLHDDLLNPLGSQWALYLDPQVGGNGMLGYVLVNRLRDANRLEKTLGQVELMANNLMRSFASRQKMTIQFKQEKVGDTTVHYLAVPFVGPSWVIRDGNLYLSLYPQVAVSAAEHVAAKGKSILDNPDYQKLLQDLGQANPSSVAFFDLPKTATDAYTSLLFLSRMYLGFGDMFGLDSPAMVLPQLKKILPLLAPAGGVSWSDDTGWHSKTVGPFPGSVLFSGGGSLAAASVGQAGLLTSIALPSLSRSRETANRVKCASNLRQIGQACLMYANEHKGKYPPDIAELVKTQDIGPEVFICPGTPEELPANLRGQSNAEGAKWVAQHSHYHYVAAGKTTAMALETIVAYEDMSNHEQGINILFADGRVEYMVAGPSLDELFDAQGIKH